MSIGGIDGEGLIDHLSGISPTKSDTEVSGKGTGSIDAGSISSSDQADESKDVVNPMASPTLASPDLTQNQFHKIFDDIHKELNASNWKSKLISNMWDKYLETITEVDKQRAVDQYNNSIREASEKGDRLRNEILTQQVLQHVVNGAMLNMFMNANQYVGQNNIEALAAVNYATFAGMSLTSQPFNDKLHNYAIDHINSLHPEGLSKARLDAQADTWVASVRASLAFTALSVLEITGAKEGEAAESREYITAALVGDLSTLRKYMSRDEIDAMFEGLVDEMRYATSMDGILGQSIALMDMVNSSAHGNNSLGMPVEA